MSTFAGEVSTLQGVVRAVNPETSEARVLEKDSPVYVGEVIETSPIGGILINMQNGSQLTLGRDTQMRIDGDVADKATMLDAAIEGAVDIAALQQAILEGNFDALEETAAGEEGTPGSASTGGVTVERVGAEGEVTSGFDTTTNATVVAQQSEDPFLTPTATPETPVSALVSISGAQTIIEGNQSTAYTISVDQPAASVISPIVVELSYSGVAIDGTDFTGVSQVTIPAGSNSITFNIDTIDDALAEGSEGFTITIGAITDVNFDSIAANDAASSVDSVITDEAEPDVAFTFQLFAADANGNVTTDASVINEEGETSANYTVLAVDVNGTALANQPTGTVDVSFTNNGTTSDADYDVSGTTVSVGTAFSSTAINDILPDSGETFTVGLVGNYSDAANYEAINYNADTVTTTITDNDRNPEANEDTFRATEEGSEFIASEDSVDTIDGVDDGVDVTGNVLDNDVTNNGNAVVTSVAFAGVTYGVDTAAATTVSTDYGDLTITSDGAVTFTVNNANPTVDALNVGDELPVDFTYLLSDGVNPEATASLNILIEGRDDAPVIESVTANNQSVNVVNVSGLLDADNDGVADTINPEDLTAQDKATEFSSNNGNLQIDLGDTPTDIAVEFNGGQAAYHNAVGYYTHDDNGALVAKIIYVENRSYVGTENIDAGTLNDLKGEVGFFIIPNGGGGNNGITTDSDIVMDSNGDMSANGESVTAYYTDNNLNSDGLDHVIAGPAEDGSGLVISFEDSALGDQDYNDFVMTVKLCTPLEGGEEYFVDLGKVSEGSQAYAWDGDSESNATWSNSDSLGNGVNVYALNFDGSDGTLLNNGDYQLGVEGSRSTGNQVPNQLHYDEVKDQSQAIAMEFEGNLNKAEFSFNRLIDSENEQGHYAAYKDGDLISEGNLVGSGLGNNPYFKIDTGNLAFNKIIFTAVQYDTGAGNGSDSSDYYIQSFQGSGPAWANGSSTILSDISLSDIDDANLEGAVLTLTNFQAGDVINAEKSLPNGITAEISDGVATLTGSASVASYEEALESLTFESTSEDRTPREFEFTVFDGEKHSNTTDVTVDIGGCSLNTSVADAPFVSTAVADDSFLHGSAEDDVFIIDNDTHDSSVTHIDNFDEINDTLDLSEVIDTNADGVDLSEYLNFANLDADGNEVDADSAKAVDTKITVDGDGDKTTTDDISTIYIQDNLLDKHDIATMNIDYQND